MDLSVVVPVYREPENVEPLLREIAHALDGRVDYEVVMVDDGSDDATPERLAAARAGYPRLRVIRHRQNRGQSAALITGIRAARAEWIATLDGDGQNDPADIPRLLSLRDGSAPGQMPDMVAGVRRKRRDNWLRRMSSRVANGVRSRLLRDDCPDSGCGLKLIRREAFMRLPHFNHMHRFLPALVRGAGGSVSTLDVNHRPRERGASKYGLFDRLWVGIVDLFGVMWLQRRCGAAESREER
jgi:dolichol-phosphate mannosyltransferase